MIARVKPRSNRLEERLQSRRLTLLSCQLVLGILAYIARLYSYDDPQPLEPLITLTVAHVVVGALTLASLVVLALRFPRHV